jgi:hypothetical protein
MRLALGTGSEGKDRLLTSLHKLDADRLNAASLDLLLHVPVNLVWLLHGVDLDDASLSLELIDDWHASIDKGLEALLDRVDVVVGTSGVPRSISMTSLPGTAGKITGGVSDICGTSLVVSLASRSSAAVSSVIAGGGEDCSADSDTDAPMSVSTEVSPRCEVSLRIAVTFSVL